MPKLVAALLAAVLAAAALAACGGGDSSTSEPSSTSASQPSTQDGGSTKEGGGQSREGANSGKSEQSQGSSGDSGRSGDSGSSGAGNSVPPLKVSGGGSSQVRTKGGDNSIQDFGEEGDESELQEAAEALRAFYVARADEDWSAACSYLASTVARQLEQLASRAPQQVQGAGCAGALHAFTRPLPPSAVRETTRIDAVSLRRDGERAFLIYRGGEGTVYATLMQDEGGTWKVAGLAGTPLN